MSKKNESLQDFLNNMMHKLNKEDKAGKNAPDLLNSGKINLHKLLNDGMPGFSDIPNLDSSIKTLEKAVILIMRQSDKLKYVESLIGPIAIIALNVIELNIDNYDESQVEELNNAMIEINNILKDVIVEEVDCNGDCNNCDKEH